MNILRRVVNAISQRKQRETLHYLQAMSAKQIESMLAEEQRCVEELERCTDAELTDLALSRGTIRHSVRHGRPGIDKHTNRQAA